MFTRGQKFDASTSWKDLQRVERLKDDEKGRDNNTMQRVEGEQREAACLPQRDQKQIVKRFVSDLEEKEWKEEEQEMNMMKMMKRKKRWRKKRKKRRRQGKKGQRDRKRKRKKRRRSQVEKRDHVKVLRVLCQQNRCQNAMCMIRLQGPCSRVYRPSLSSLDRCFEGRRKKSRFEARREEK